MKIKWLGHACFSLTSQTGLKLITDPYESGFRNILNYGPIKESADIVTVSHEHGDHNCVSAVAGNPAVVKGSGITRVKGIEFKGIAVYHDQVKGAERGPNTIFVFELDGIRLAHLGDLGHPLAPEQRRELENTEVLFAPTGGPMATLELQEVIDLWASLKPGIVIPMHFKTAKCAFPKYGAEDLIRLRPDAKRVGASEVSLTKEQLPTATQILVLDPLL
jgi:L-ascorbate metabolism protein UlaG (beta-lactamase superfamily)